MARGFVRHGLQILPSGLETEIRWIYLEQGKLAKIIADSTALIASSRDRGGQSSNPAGLQGREPAINRLTLGGILTLERTLSHLQSILDSEGS
jgi:ubiquitin-conjugating enzyme E2 O